jgi:hypothetical protein
VCSSRIARLFRHRRFCSSESAKLLEAPIAVVALERLSSWLAGSLAGSLPKLEISSTGTGNRGTATGALAATARMGTSAGLAPVRELPFLSNPHCR